MATIVDGVDSKWIYSADDQYVAVASGRINGDWDEVMSNGRLIAAAPEMYEALKGIEGTYVFLDSVTSGMEPQHTNTRNALAKVRAAIAKAEGREVGK